MTHYYKIREDKKNTYSGLKAFIDYPAALNQNNVGDSGIYYHWRLAPNHQDLMVVTKIQIEDLVLVKVYK